MEKVTQKFIRALINAGEAQDLTHTNFEDMQKWIAEHPYYRQIAYSTGVYGCNGKLLKDPKSGELFGIVGRTNAMFMV